MRAIRLIFVIILICFVLQTGEKYSYSQEKGFIITLKNGMEIKTFNILIEKGMLYYMFSSYGKRKAGIATSAIAKILERKRSGEVNNINIPPPSKTIAKGKLVEKTYLDKSKKEIGPHENKKN